ncbi:MAG: hypothetical protein RLZZ450_1477 [Pseudomonadota bacterium]
MLRPERAATPKNHVLASLEYPVEDRLGEVVVVQDVAPGPQLLVRREDHGLAREVALVDDTEEHVGGIRCVHEVANLVDDQDMGLDPSRRNGQRILEDPTIPIRLLSQQRATFRREDMLKVLHTHSVDAEQFDRCLHAVMACPELVELPTGRYTSQEMLSAERRLLDAADVLAKSEVHLVAERHVRTAVERAEERLARQVAGSGQPPPKVSEEQRRAITHLTASSGSIALLEGHAGTGKSFLLGAAREAWEAQGLTVIGGALAGKAAEGLQLSSGISSRTLASWERSWSLERDELTAKHVLVIDEAGMLGTRQLGRVLEAAREAGAKVVLVGDSRQLQAIEAGSPFRVLGERIGTETLAEVRRQRVDWQREATMAFADKRPKEALAAYRSHGNVRVSLTTEQTRAAVVAAWAKGLESTPLHEQMMYAHRRDDVRALNELAREVRRCAAPLASSARTTRSRASSASASLEELVRQESPRVRAAFALDQTPSWFEQPRRDDPKKIVDTRRFWLGMTLEPMLPGDDALSHAWRL